MAATTHINTRKGVGFGGVSAMIENLVERYTRYRIYRQTFNELASLSNRELADLGLNRCELRRVALQAAYD
jgi:uncharacterized protein YjiS (DUF1127 family)